MALSERASESELEHDSWNSSDDDEAPLEDLSSGSGFFPLARGVVVVVPNFHLFGS